MAEQVLGRRRKNIKIGILRPSSILACCKQPFVAWVDSVGTAGSVHMPMGLGLSNTFNLKPKPAMQTVVPCDVVVNAILVASMVVACLP
jgi:hypothetical protein